MTPEHDWKEQDTKQREDSACYPIFSMTSAALLLVELGIDLGHDRGGVPLLMRSGCGTTSTRTSRQDGGRGMPT